MKKAGEALAVSKSPVAVDQPGDRWVTMGNALTRAGQGLSLSEKRLVMLAVSKLDSKRPASVKQSDLLTTRVSASEYAEAFKVDPNTAYEALQSASKNLFGRKITFFEPANRRGGKPIKPARVDMRWVGRCTYHDNEAWVELAWWPEILPALCGLKQNFTSYQLQQASALRSIYTWRLLELLTKFEKTGWAQYDIEDFRASLETPPSLVDFAQLKRRVLDPAVKELTEKDGWLITWEAIKAGRRVKALRFIFKRDPQGRLAL